MIRKGNITLKLTFKKDITAFIRVKSMIIKEI
ncbi:hypothetical protein AH03_71 [Erwinia phage AH03]|uniref:Uncharacterized protein n=1 Tax=Erwinia phage AH03 TaxID=2869568 RepID=A0AAE8BQS8_9CAUD|nr:hypothetical protein AH03_71 [Erwinia phage AH03]